MISTAITVGHLFTGRIRYNVVSADAFFLRVGQESGHSRKALRPSHGQIGTTRTSADPLVTVEKGNPRKTLCPIGCQQGEVCHEMVLDFPYLDQFIREVLRMYPALPRLTLWNDQSLSIDLLEFRIVIPLELNANATRPLRTTD